MKTVPTPADISMTATSPIQHLCPFMDEVDNGTITINWVTGGATFELHALRAYLDAFKDLRISHEELTERIRRELSQAHGIDLLTVRTSWTTAGMEVRCSS